MESNFLNHHSEFRNFNVEKSGIWCPSKISTFPFEKSTSLGPNGDFLEFDEFKECFEKALKCLGEDSKRFLSKNMFDDNSSKDGQEDDLSVLIDAGKTSNGVFVMATKEEKLKNLPDVTYATFAGKLPQDIYDKICIIPHFGHIANRILRRLYSGGFVDAFCGNTLGKNRKVRAEQRRYFEELSEGGIHYLHSILKMGKS